MNDYEEIYQSAANLLDPDEVEGRTAAEYFAETGAGPGKYEGNAVPSLAVALVAIPPTHPETVK